jgi:PAS domain S-box-containing protein
VLTQELETLTRQESQYARSLIEASLDPLVTINTEGKITDMNQATANITGLTREKLTGTDFFDYFTEPQKAREVYQEVFAKGSVADSPLTLRHKNGKLTDVLFNGSVYRDDRGNVLGVVIVARDVTAQKLLSKYSLSLIEASLDPLVTISTEGKITDMNQATSDITGIAREKLTGTDFFDYFTEPQKAREVYQEVFAKGSVADSPLTLRHKNGKLTDVLFNGSVYKDDRGNVLGVVIVARDVTDQKRIATELNEAKVFAELATEFAEEAKRKAESATQIAENAVKAKQQFLSNMSHEIRTPMNAIIGFTKVVLKTELTERQKEYLNAIKTSGDALIVLINDILDLAKVDAGKMTFEQTPFKMALSLSAMLHLFETKIQEKNLALVKEYDKKIPEVLVGDSVRLHQIILNLVSNAVKFTSAGKITVAVILKAEDEEKVMIEFAVTDTGIGISKDKIQNIFENFQQATSGTSRLYGGTGLGLAIVKQLVEAQGGSIQVKSKIDEGSTFSFTLGFLKTKSDAEMETNAVELYTEIKNIKVLVVEDIALNQLLMKTLLDDFGFECEIAENGKIAIEKLQTKSYDIILMDLQMPEMNGFEATEYIRSKMKSKTPIIALTADVTTVDLAKCKSVGMNDYIAKPVDERLLYNKMIGFLKKPTHLKDIESNEALEFGVKKTKCINLDYLLGRTKSNPKLIKEMISLYLGQTKTLISIMKQSLEDKDWKVLQSAAHKMIPSFVVVGLNKDYEHMAREIQELASAHQTKGLPELVSQLENILVQACVELEEEAALIKDTKG